MMGNVSEDDEVNQKLLEITTRSDAIMYKARGGSLSICVN